MSNPGEPEEVLNIEAAEDVKKAIEDTKKKDAEPSKHEAASQQESGHSAAKDDLIKDLPPLDIRLRYHKELTESKTRQVLVYSIIAIFTTWILISLFYFVFTSKDDMLTAGSAVISGPFGAVLGYYLAKESQKEK